jgi:hypothetical protein
VRDGSDRKDGKGEKGRVEVQGVSSQTSERGSRVVVVIGELIGFGFGRCVGVWCVEGK